MIFKQKDPAFIVFHSNEKEICFLWGNYYFETLISPKERLKLGDVVIGPTELCVWGE